MSFKEMVPFVIVTTLIMSILIAKKIKKKEILTTDGTLSIIGLGLGLVVTFLNLIYSNNYLIALGPTLTIASLLYLRFRNKILTNGMTLDINLSGRTLKVISIIYWISISIALISYIQAVPYYRPPIFFIFISFGVAMLGLDIISSIYKDNFRTFGMIFKILLISLILRASANFISQYPIGSDPWGHADLINDISSFGNLNVPPTSTAVYYINYPLMHIYTVSINLIGNLGIKGSMFIIGVVLALSTMFVYLIVKIITGNTNLALLSMLMLNFADFHIQWSIGIIAMSFGIAIYTILFYLIVEMNEKHRVLNASFLIMYLFIITWTHTVSGFIALVSIISLFVGSSVYKLIYKKIGDERPLVNFTFCSIFVIMLLYHWMDPNYPFFDSITNGLINSLSSEAKFLGRTATSNVTEGWENIFNITGFLIYIFFGIIGSLYCSKRYTETKVSLIFMIVVLFFILFAFPIFGMRNIVPYRWPAFIYVNFVLFVGIGLMGILSLLKSRHTMTMFILSVLFVSSFLMITNFVTDMDSPVYGEEINQKLVWTESEMSLFEKINESYDGTIVGDLQTIVNPFWTYLKRKDVAIYETNEEDIGDMNWEHMDNKLIIWREINSIRPARVNGYIPEMLFEEKVKNHFDSTFNIVYNTGEARAYLKALR